MSEQVNKRSRSIEVAKMVKNIQYFF